jgi:serine/threonine-protein kinase RsbW
MPPTIPDTHRAASAAESLTWCRVFPATPVQVPQARRWMQAILDGHPAAADAALCLDELAVNAMWHSASGRPGGHFTVRAGSRGGRLRVEVTDQGGPWVWPEHGAGQDGRGLLIVSELAADWGRRGGPAGWTVWFEMGIGRR